MRYSKLRNIANETRQTKITKTIKKQKLLRKSLSQCLKGFTFKKSKSELQDLADNKKYWKKISSFSSNKVLNFNKVMLRLKMS